MNAIEVEDFTFVYPERENAAVMGVDLHVPAGQFLLLAGPSGSGKSTLLRALCGLVPHATGGRMAGAVRVNGRSTRDVHPRQLADVVGFVHQDPESQFVVDEVERDIAFVLENLGQQPAAMRRRVEEVLDALGIAHLRHRAPATLSGGEKQRCAIAGALAAGPSVLVLDEPTSQLDPQGADDVLAALSRLNHDLATTIVIAEHRLERAAPLADRACLLEGGRINAAGPPGEVLARYEGAAPVTHLGRLLGWEPPPLTVKEARAHMVTPPPFDLDAIRVARDLPAVPIGTPLVVARNVRVSLAGRCVLGPVDLTFRRGEIVALLGRNGSGKTTLLRTLARLTPVDSGGVTTADRVAYVPQDPNSLLFSATARREVAETLRLLGRSSDDAVAEWLARLGLDRVAERHPRTLSGGERQRLAVAAVAVGGAPGLLLDETTRGMDAPSRRLLESAVREHAERGGLVVLATHDVELAARVATRVIVLGDGEVVADGVARDVLAGSLFAPQVLRVMPPALTVDEVAATWARHPSR